MPAWGLDSSFAAPGLNEATQQLSRAMLKQALTQKQNWNWVIGVVLLVIAFPLGALVAWTRVKPPLLTTTSAPTSVMKKYDNIDAQMLAALLAQQNREQALKAVWEYFPPGNSPEALRKTRIAKAQLAAFYLQQNRFAESAAVYHELASVEESETEFRIQGFAGETVVLDRQGQEDQVRERLPTLSGINYLQVQKDLALKAEVDALFVKYKLPLPK
jgi:hypothetical protein